VAKGSGPVTRVEPVLVATRRIPADVMELLGRHGGLVHVATARTAGVDPSRLRRLAIAGRLTRIAEGVYADASMLVSLGDWQLHRLKARGYLFSCAADACLTGWSAAVTWDFPTVGVPPDVPVVVRPKAESRGPTTTTFGRVLVAAVPDSHRVQSSSIRIVSRAWTVADLARTAPVPHALVVADAAVRQGVDLDSVLQHMARWKGIHRARWVTRHANPAAESALETLGRFTCMEFDLPMPVCNAWVGSSGPVYRVDGLWPFHWSAYEADGALKYDNRPDASSIVAAQSEREFYLRRLGLDVARYGWDLGFRRRATLAERFSALLRDNPARAEPIRWWKHVPGVGPVKPEPADWPSPQPVPFVLPAGWDVDVMRTGHRPRAGASMAGQVSMTTSRPAA
jgi:hypothetical protein